MIYLLDLNYTLVANSTEKIKPFSQQIEKEVYRQDLIEALSGETVILVTARPQKYKEQTLASIQEKTGWTPDKAFFNEIEKPPSVLKEHILTEIIFIQFGATPQNYFAIESNPFTRRMYNRYAVKSQPYKDFMEQRSVLYDLENS